MGRNVADQGTEALTKRAGAFSPCTATETADSTHPQKLNKICRGQTIPEAVRPLSEQRHQRRIMTRDKTVRRMSRRRHKNRQEPKQNKASTRVGQVKVSPEGRSGRCTVRGNRGDGGRALCPGQWGKGWWAARHWWTEGPRLGTETHITSAHLHKEDTRSHMMGGWTAWEEG